MSKMFIRVRKDGFIYEYNELMAANPACEVIPEEIAYPERFVNTVVVAEVQKARAKRKSAIDLSTADIPEEPVYINPELAAEASRGLP